MKNITGKYGVYGVIGDPIEHTLSPLIHNTLAKTLGHDGVYVPFHVKGEGLEEAIRGAYALGIRGLNVTMPHKQEVIQYLTAIDSVAEQAMAVNTLVYTEKGYKGYNTDIGGLRLAMERSHIEWANKHVAIIGSGGASFAACLCVIKEAKTLTIYNRTLDNAKHLKAHLEQFYQTPIQVYTMDDIQEETVDIVIQTTGVGMGALEGQMPACSKALLMKASVAVDLIYNPWETAFLAYAKSLGCQVVNGFDMLYYQAVEAYEKMHHCEMDESIKSSIREAVLKELNLFEQAKNEEV